MVDESDETKRTFVRRRRVEGGRQHRHVVRVTAEEEGELYVRALRYHVSIPKLLVDSALAGGSENAASNASVQQELLTTLFTTHRLLAGIANNVNQIARVGNSTGVVPAEASAVLDAARRAAEQIDELVDAIAEAIR